MERVSIARLSVKPVWANSACTSASVRKRLAKTMSINMSYNFPNDERPSGSTTRTRPCGTMARRMFVKRVRTSSSVRSTSTRFEDIQVASCRHCLQKIPSDELTPSPQGLCLERRLGTFHDDGQVKKDPLQGRKCL